MSTGLIDYPSANPFEIQHILRDLAGATPQPMFGWLILPEAAAERVPCVVCCHGSLGWRGHHHEHMVRWLEAGIAVFRVHSFDARRVQSVVEDQIAVTHAMLLADAYAALQLLARHPRILGDRIGVAGWSLGGTVALYAAWEPLAEALAPAGERFAVHLPIYPAAHLRPEEHRWTGAPMRVLHGEADDYTPFRFVEALVAEQGLAADCITYPGAHHSFDSIEPLTWLPDAIRLGKGTITIARDGAMYSVGGDGTRYPMGERAERQATFAARKTVGAHIGGSWEARRKVFDDGAEFFAKQLLD